MFSLDSSMLIMSSPFTLILSFHSHNSHMTTRYLDLEDSTRRRQEVVYTPEAQDIQEQD